MRGTGREVIQQCVLGGSVRVHMHGQGGEKREGEVDLGTRLGLGPIREKRRPRLNVCRIAGPLRS
jgi:hypothetical protein